MKPYCAKYDPLFDIPNGVDTFVLTGGRFTGKSHVVSSACLTLVNNQNRKWLCSRYTMTSAKRSIIPEVKEKIEGLNLDKYYEQVNNSFIGFGHREIAFSGIKTSSGNLTASLKGLKGYSIWSLDEAEEMVDEAEFDTINFSIRAEDVNYKVLIINPTSKTHWIYRKYFEAAGVKDGFNGVKNNVCYIHTTYLDVLEHIPSSILQDIERLKNTNLDKYNHIIMGGWLDKAEGVIFKNWHYGKFDDSLPYSYALDLGFFPDPDALVKVAIDKANRKLYVHEGVYSTENTPDQLATEIVSITKGSIVIHDTNEPRVISHLVRHGAKMVKAEKGAGSVLEGIKLMQDYEIIVTPSSTNIGLELNNFTQKNGIPIGEYNHAISAIRYNLMYFVGAKKKHSTKSKLY